MKVIDEIREDDGYYVLLEKEDGTKVGRYVSLENLWFESEGDFNSMDDFKRNVIKIPDRNYVPLKSKSLLREFILPEEWFEI